MASSILGRMWLAFRAGIQFAGKRNLYEVFGYPRVLSPEVLLAKYQRQDIATRVVDMPPEEMWSLPPIISKPAQLQDIWNDFARRTDLWQRIIQADKLCSFGRFSALWIGLPGNQETPARTLRNTKDILYLQAYGGPTIEVDEYERDTGNPRFGQPIMYRVMIGPTENQTTQLVHHSRIIHIVDRPLQGLIFGEPRLAQVYNVLDDMLKVGGGCAESFWLTANRGMQVDVDKDMELSKEDATQLTDELDEFQHQLRRYVRTRGVKINNLGSDVADPTGVYKVLLSTLSGATAIPQRILVGAEAGQLASEQDRANWAEYMRRRRTVFAEPYVLKPILAHLVMLGLAGKEVIDLVEWEWPEPFQLNPLEEAQTLASKARAIASLAQRGRFGSPIVSDEESRRMFGLDDKPNAGDTMPKATDNNPDLGAGDMAPIDNPPEEANLPSKDLATPDTTTNNTRSTANNTQNVVSLAGAIASKMAPNTVVIHMPKTSGTRTVTGPNGHKYTITDEAEEA